MEPKDLIERAATRCGSQAAVARAMGVLPLRITQWKSGTVPCPAWRIDQLAELAGLPMETRVRTVWEAVRKAAGKAVALLAIGVVAITLCSSLAGQGVQLAGASGPFRRR